MIELRPGILVDGCYREISDPRNNLPFSLRVLERGSSDPQKKDVPFGGAVESVDLIEVQDTDVAGDREPGVERRSRRGKALKSYNRKPE
jgi:hypothetical protein